MKLLRQTKGSASTEQVVTVLLVGVIGVVGMRTLGGAMGTAIAKDAAGSPMNMTGSLAVASQAAAEHGYTIQVIAYGRGRQADAQAYADKLRNQNGFDAFVEQNESGLWVVRINHVSSASEADDILDQYKALGLTGDAFVADHSGLVTPNERAYFETVAAQQAQQQQEAAAAAETPAATATPTPETPAASEGSGIGTVDTGAAPKVTKEKKPKDDGGFSLTGAIGGTLNGLWNGGIGVVKQVGGMAWGLVKGAKSLVWDFGVEDVLGGIAGPILKLPAMGVNKIFGTHLLEDMSWIPLKDAAMSVGHFVWNTPKALWHVLNGFWHNSSLCLNPWNGQTSSNRGQSCGRAVTDVATVLVAWTKLGKAGEVANAAGEIGTGAKAIGAGTTAAEGAGAVRIAGELTTGSGGASTAAKAGETASAAGKASEAANAGKAGEASNAGKAAEASETAGTASKTAKASDAAETGGNGSRAADAAEVAEEGSKAALKAERARLSKLSHEAAYAEVRPAMEAFANRIERMWESTSDLTKHVVNTARKGGTLDAEGARLQAYAKLEKLNEEASSLARQYREMARGEAPWESPASVPVKLARMEKRLAEISGELDSYVVKAGESTSAKAGAATAAKSGGGLINWVKNLFR